MIHTLHPITANEVLFIYVGQPDLNVYATKKTIKSILNVCKWFQDHQTTDQRQLKKKEEIEKISNG